MPKAFFCHASEDKPVVEAVYQRLKSNAPDIAPWLDKYEIVGGQSLIDRIAEGMDDSDKFVVFLSRISVKKPWVRRELRRAIMREIADVEPDHIIPVLVEPLDTIPPFLEDKKYIALYGLTETEWIAELSAAIRGRRPGDATTAEFSNVRAMPVAMPGARHKIQVTIEAQAWAEKMAYAVTTSSDIVDAKLVSGGVFMMIDEVREARAFGIICDSPELRPGQPIVLEIEFAPGVDGVGAITGLARIVRP